MEVFGKQISAFFEEILTWCAVVVVLEMALVLSAGTSEENEVSALGSWTFHVEEVWMAIWLCAEELPIDLSLADSLKENAFFQEVTSICAISEG